MLQILPDHFLGHFPDRRTKILPRPKMPTLISLIQRWKLFEQFDRRPSLDPLHDLARRHLRRRRDQNVHMILADHTLDDPNFERFAGLLHQLPNPLPHISRQQLVPILGHPNKVILNLVNHVAPISIVHLAFVAWPMIFLNHTNQKVEDKIGPPERWGFEPYIWKSKSN